MSNRNNHSHSKQNNKNRMNGSAVSINPQEDSHKRRPKSAKYDEMQSVKSMFYSTFEQHPEECLCKECICGRHLCKFNSPSPNLSLSTTYRRHYPPRNPSRYRQGPHRPQSAALIENPLLTFSSTYKDSFFELNGDGLERPKPNDLLKCKGGPSQELTSYSKQFPGHKGKNQHVPMNPEPSRGGLQFNASTTYSKQYVRPAGKSAQKARPPDQLSMTGSWFGGSSYRDQYQNPQNHVSSSKKMRNDSSRSVASSSDSKKRDFNTPRNTSSHFKTTYNNDFVKNNAAICPAAKTLLDQSGLEKSNFKENTHFKGMDSRYESLAKHQSFK